MRQSSDVHERVLSELFNRAGVEPNYAALSEELKLEHLLQELYRPRLLYSPYLNYSDETQSELAVLRTAREIRLCYGERAIRNYNKSHTKTVSDLLEVYLLQRETGKQHKQTNNPTNKTTKPKNKQNQKVIPLF